jgi:hypothetical protein
MRPVTGALVVISAFGNSTTNRAPRVARSSSHARPP